MPRAKGRAPRDTRKYHFKSQSGKILHSGITRRPIAEREAEHRRTLAARGYIEKVGNRTTWEAARKWEDKQPKGSPPGGR